jgi:hypothetical protein
MSTSQHLRCSRHLVFHAPRRAGMTQAGLRLEALPAQSGLYTRPGLTSS